MKGSLWSVDIFRCESITLRTHWVLVVMDQFTRRIIGFGVHRGIVDGLALCRMFQQAIRGQSLPKYLSTDNDPLYRFHQWQANLRNRYNGSLSVRSEEHTSELQSLRHLVCRLLLEKKKKLVMINDK